MTRATVNFVEKWTNLTDAGETASNTADGGVNTDYPLFRLADVYLMMAEAVVRGGSGTTATEVVDYINQIQERAYGDDSNNKDASQINLSYFGRTCPRTLLGRASSYRLNPLWSIHHQWLPMAMERRRKRGNSGKQPVQHLPDTDYRVDRQPESIQ